MGRNIAAEETIIKFETTMKNLTIEEIQKTPTIICFIYVCSLAKIPIGASTFEQAMEEYPEYFQEELERRTKWQAIPQYVHDGYWKEYWELEKETFKNVPHKNKGIWYFANHPEESAEHDRAWKKAFSKSKQLRKKLHDKYYKKFGISWEGA